MTQVIKRFLVRNVPMREDVGPAIEEILTNLRKSNWVGVYEVTYLVGDKPLRPIPEGLTPVMLLKVDGGSNELDYITVKPELKGMIEQFGIVQIDGIKYLYVDVDVTDREETFAGTLTAMHDQTFISNTVNRDSKTGYDFIRFDRHGVNAAGDLYCLATEMIEGED